ncbi:MAG: hypothetical protein LBI54_07745 [Lachnospiraceae bacterium]|jgi:hypothetical protein|nr:hypothetical protein [Lachnospiraceae bacterium]
MLLYATTGDYEYCYIQQYRNNFVVGHKSAFLSDSAGLGSAPPVKPKPSFIGLGQALLLSTLYFQGTVPRCEKLTEAIGIFRHCFDGMIERK